MVELTWVRGQFPAGEGSCCWNCILSVVPTPGSRGPGLGEHHHQLGSICPAFAVQPDRVRHVLSMPSMSP